MSSKVREKIRAELAARRSGDDADAGSRVLALLSPIQKKFVLDSHRFKIARAGRRSGKSFADAIYLIHEALAAPNTPCLYVGLTRDSAKGAVWQLLVSTLQSLGIKHEAMVSGPIINFPNGSFIQLLGADAANAQNRIRGRKYKLVIVDEMGFFSGADGLILNTLIPTLADYQGTLCMTSSPGMTLHGLFYEADQGTLKESWSRYHWTLVDNPHFQRPATDPRFKTLGEQELHTICTMQFGGDRDHPSFRREYLGEWVRDDRSLVYPTTAENILHTAPLLPQQHHALGVNLSSPNRPTVVVTRFSPQAREVIYIEEWVGENATLDQVAGAIKDMSARYDSIYMVAYTGSLGMGVVDEMRRRYQLPMDATGRSDKPFYQRAFRADLSAGFIQVLSHMKLLEEWNTLTRDAADDEIPGSPNELSDAAFAVYRKVYQSHLKSYEAPKSEERKMIEYLENSLRSESLEDADE